MPFNRLSNNIYAMASRSGLHSGGHVTAASIDSNDDTDILIELLKDDLEDLDMMDVDCGEQARAADNVIGMQMSC